ncbi:MAG: phosphate signaling complex protein PhoU [Chloroflexi bacterium]|nr:phosphate signaling complex protein PhoU [Chloroflexota bacterium]MCI0575562.1 phosphate signaling complex protein PhoU [Chloroflexota bacterium]MCI0649968.1 phosphate signaling complex protein PhoU [Chloroflexota bacterium]MCI0729298.1 phosphate signaling complex protein PhoU [Chloroflexota bacterium]
MPSRSRAILDQEIDQVNTHLLQLASMVSTAVEQAMTALAAHNLEEAHQVIVNDDQINRLRYEVEEECLRILATQQPAAGDLRKIIAAIHIAVELERMGDHAAGIAALVERMAEEPVLETLHQLPKMAKRARKMMEAALEAFVTLDAEKARAMVRRDDKLDRNYAKLFLEAIKEMEEDSYVRRATYLLWIGHNLERIGDRATNIAERVIFMTTGEFVELNTH